MEERLLTEKEYENAILKRKEYRDKLFEVRIELFMNKNNTEKIKLLKEKESFINKTIMDLSQKVCAYEIENNIEKEGKKK